MAKKFTLRKRQNKILYAEFFVASIIIALLTVIGLKLHPAVGIIIALLSIFGIVYLFFQFRIFRYLFSILFSLGWATGAFLIGQQIEKSSNTTGWVLSIVTFAIAIWLHYDHFDFLRKTTVYEYERQ